MRAVRAEGKPLDKRGEITLIWWTFFVVPCCRCALLLSLSLSLSLAASFPSSRACMRACVHRGVTSAYMPGR